MGVFCDGGCPVKAEIEGDDIKILPANPELPAICAKVKLLDSYRFHPDRVTKPLKNMGKKGEPVWEEISWDQALDEIADRLKAVIAEHGPEAVAFAEMPLNIGMGGITRRLMNCIGSPNYTAPVQLCMGNTAQVHRAVYGWFAFADWSQADCIVYFGQDRDGERWPREYLQLRAALKRGAKLIEVDPRMTETAKLAQYHLPIRYGTDAALALAWINTIIEEDLYDHDFVESQCIGFEELRERAGQYDADTVATICNIDSETIRETARVFVTSKHAIIPWGVVGDMQVNSTSLLQAQCILRAICGFVNNGETVFGPSVGALTNAQVADFGKLADEKRRIQLGVDTHPLLTFKASELYAGANARIGLPYEPDIIAESCACDPSTLFAAMRGEGPYPVKAMFSVGNNTVMSYAGQQGIIDAFKNQDLVVTFENWVTPTAQLSDYVLPGDMWAERDFLGSPFDVAPALSACQAFCEPVGECRNWYFVVKGLAGRLGFAAEFPWKDEHELFDWRLQPLGESWESAVAKAPAPVLSKPIAMEQFVTPLRQSGACKLGVIGARVRPSSELPGAKRPRCRSRELPLCGVCGIPRTPFVQHQPAPDSRTSSEGSRARVLHQSDRRSGRKAGKRPMVRRVVGLRVRPPHVQGGRGAAGGDNSHSPWLVKAGDGPRLRRRVVLRLHAQRRNALPGRRLERRRSSGRSQLEGRHSRAGGCFDRYGLARTRKNGMICDVDFRNRSKKEGNSF